mmetsp:Transcript_13748/g.51417  ORF Transcript_13748/g.51417 Transcript_13748/m.51417 type:complete len:318 (+) Transcript_13748:1247-2200(+)
MDATAICASSRPASASKVVASISESRNKTSSVSSLCVNSCVTATCEFLFPLSFPTNCPAGDGAGETTAPQPGNILNGDRMAAACFFSVSSQYVSYASWSKDPSCSCEAPELGDASSDSETDRSVVSASYESSPSEFRDDPDETSLASSRESICESETCELSSSLFSIGSAVSSATGDGDRFGGSSEGGSLVRALRRRRVISAVLGRFALIDETLSAPAPAPPSCCRYTSKVMTPVRSFFSVSVVTTGHECVLSYRRTAAAPDVVPPPDAPLNPLNLALPLLSCTATTGIGGVACVVPHPGPKSPWYRTRSVAVTCPV